MRQLRIFDDSVAADTLRDALFAQGIQTTLNETREGGFALWVHDEAELAAAQTIAKEFELDPRSARFTQAKKVADSQRRAETQSEKKSRHRTLRAAEILRSEERRQPPVTVGLALVCVLVYALMNSAHGDKLTSLLSIQGRGTILVLGSWSPLGLFADVLSGEVWRLVTPIFLHFGILHLVFNLSWLWVFGKTLEGSLGSLRFGFMVLLLGVFSNVLQYVATVSPSFGGMSGVIYGLFGYLWMRGRFDPRVSFGLPGSTVMIMIGWYVLCLTGIVGAVANGAHTGGLVLGTLWGYLASGDLGRRSV